jgi:hypothetical protein
MQYLHLVHLAGSKRYSRRPACKRQSFAAETIRCAADGLPAGQGSGLVTDGPFIETKEYLAGPPV